MQKAQRSQGTGIPFWKLHGAGNDILVVFAEDLPRSGKAAAIKRLGHRQLGLGCDQLIEVLSLKPLSIQIWNGDGTKAEMCANGTRTFLYVAALEKWINARAAELTLEISGAPYTAIRRGAGAYELCLGTPRLEAFDRIALSSPRELSVPLHEVNVGNPHAVILCGSKRGQWEPPADFDFRVYGAAIERHPQFPRKTNVMFVREWKQTGASAEARVEVWERGAGATLSCGSGAVAVAAVLKDQLKVKRVAVRMTDFILRIRFEGDEAYLSGPCTLVGKGTYFR